MDDQFRQALLLLRESLKADLAHVNALLRDSPAQGGVVADSGGGSTAPPTQAGPGHG